MVIFLKHSVWIVLKHVMSLTEPLCASTVWSALGYHMHAACSISQAAAQLRCTRAHLQGRKCFTRLCSNDIGRNQAKITVLSCIPWCTPIARHSGRKAPPSIPWLEMPSTHCWRVTFTYDVSHRTNHRLWITARHATVERVSKCRVENDDHGARMHMTRRHYPQGTNICIGVLKRPACFLSARSES